ncbi:hypothetical protein TCON_0646 [Astathelohania contejeani]|uniref:Uncharacterized protein n=1 Tax=Astathelohania contejeani TaxID=164912 RepID=A0ABQ7I143_9MICR|nr:hypothetical protein TCON_0646 [Thelohania contejeani]
MLANRNSKNINIVEMIFIIALFVNFAKSVDSEEKKLLDKNSIVVCYCSISTKYDTEFNRAMQTAKNNVDHHFDILEDKYTKFSNYLEKVNKSSGVTNYIDVREYCRYNIIFSILRLAVKDFDSSNIFICLFVFGDLLGSIKHDNYKSYMVQNDSLLDISYYIIRFISEVIEDHNIISNQDIRKMKRKNIECLLIESIYNKVNRHIKDSIYTKEEIKNILSNDIDYSLSNGLSISINTSINSKLNPIKFEKEDSIILDFINKYIISCKSMIIPPQLYIIGNLDIIKRKSIIVMANIFNIDVYITDILMDLFISALLKKDIKTDCENSLINLILSDDRDNNDNGNKGIYLEKMGFKTIKQYRNKEDICVVFVENMSEIKRGAELYLKNFCIWFTQFYKNHEKKIDENTKKFYERCIKGKYNNSNNTTKTPDYNAGDIHYNIISIQKENNKDQGFFTNLINQTDDIEINSKYNIVNQENKKPDILEEVKSEDTKEESCRTGSTENMDISMEDCLSENIESEKEEDCSQKSESEKKEMSIDGSTGNKKDESLSQDENAIIPANITKIPNVGKYINNTFNQCTRILIIISCVINKAI